MKPLLAEKSQQFESMFTEYMNKLKAIIQEQGFDLRVQTVMIEEETRKMQQVKRQVRESIFLVIFQLFGDSNVSAKVLDREIEARKNILAIEKRIVTIQAVYRGR